MLRRVAQLAVRRRRLILVLAAVAFAVSGAVGGGVASQLSSGGFEDPNAESTKAEDALLERFGAGPPNVILLVTGKDGRRVDDPEVAAYGQELTQRLAGEGDVVNVASYWSVGSPPSLRNDGGTRALVFARIEGDDDAVRDRVESLAHDYETENELAQVEMGGQAKVFRTISETIERGLFRAEAIAFPITLVLLLIVFGSVVAATLPLAIGALSIVGTFLVLLLLSKVTEVSVFSLNLATGMGLGLAIDYSLFIVSRYREELHAGLDPHAAVRRTVQTAGKTVAFSALTVAVALSALLVFPLAFLRSFAYAGTAVAVLAGVYAVVVLPALLAALGRNVDRLTLWRRSTKPADEGVWHAVALRVMRRPIPIATAVVVVLLLLGGPVLGIELGLPDDRVLPAGHEGRALSDVLRREFPSREAGTLTAVATGIGDPRSQEVAIDGYASALARLDNVARVDALTGTYCAAGLAGQTGCPPGLLVRPAAGNPEYQRFGAPDATYVNVVPAVEPLSDEGEALARAVRAVEGPFSMDVGGDSARLVDAKRSLVERLPVAAAVIALVTFVLLFLMFGSVVVPTKAVVLNVLSLSATFGAMVWVFQDGHLSGLLDFTPTGTLDSTSPILMFCVAFGLSMDYEVFLLSRIKEEYDRTGDNVRSVAVGLERTGGIVTAAAVLMSVIFISFTTTEVSFIKLFGLGLTVAVLADAFLIRGTLVPAFMRLAGDWNWWAPRALRRVHDRYGISEVEAVELPDRADREPEHEDVLAR